MSSDPDMLLLDLVGCHGLITAEAVLRDVQHPACRGYQAAGKAQLKKAAYIHPSCYWYMMRPLGAQALPTRASVLCHCVFSENRWELQGWDGPEAICSRRGLTEAVFPDLNASPTHIMRKLCRYYDRRTRDVTGLTLLLPSDSKASTIARTLANNNLPLPVRLVVIEDLYYLLARPSCRGNR